MLHMKTPNMINLCRMNPSIIYVDDYSIVYSLKFRWKLEPCYDPSHVKLETYVGPIFESNMLYDIVDYKEHFIVH